MDINFSFKVRLRCRVSKRLRKQLRAILRPLRRLLWLIELGRQLLHFF
jgi:hypothetical protein